MKVKTVSLNKKRRRKIGLAFIVLAMLIVAAFVVGEIRIKPVLSTIAESRAKNIATEAVNDAVWLVLSEENIKYDNLVDMALSEDGRINAVKVDSIKLNRLCSDIRARITDYFNLLGNKVISIPIGSLSRIGVLSGKGPKIPITVTLSGSSSTKIKNDFETAGINQTRHQMILEIVTKVYVLTQSGNFSTEVSNSIVVAETVIVGEVPEIYSDGKDDLWQNLTEYGE